MIKTDIINQVAKAADITRVKAVVAVEAVLESRADRVAWLRRLPGQAPQEGDWPEPEDRQGSPHSSGEDDPLQARQEPAESLARPPFTRRS